MNSISGLFMIRASL